MIEICRNKMDLFSEKPQTKPFFVFGWRSFLLQTDATPTQGIIAVAEYGKGRIVAVTDKNFLNNIAGKYTS